MAVPAGGVSKLDYDQAKNWDLVAVFVLTESHGVEGMSGYGDQAVGILDNVHAEAAGQEMVHKVRAVDHVLIVQIVAHTVGHALGI